MSRRKSLRSLDPATLLAAGASLLAVAALGVLVHDIMWSRVAADEAARTPVKQPARISSKSLTA